jgi:hypothetical protein
MISILARLKTEMKKVPPPIPKGCFTVADVQEARGCSSGRAREIVRDAVRAGLWERLDWTGSTRFIYRERVRKIAKKD